MKFKTVKKPSEVVLDGISVELDIVNDVIKGITLKDAKGNLVRVAERSYNIFVEVPCPPEKEKKHKLSGEVIGLPVEKLFDDKYAAEDEKRRLESESSTAELKVEEVELDIPF